MSRFRSLVKSTSFPALLSQHGEPIVYLRGDGQKRRIMAIVTRDEMAILAELGEAIQAAAIVSLTDDPDIGVSRAELDSQLDFFLLADHEGGEPRKRAVTKVLNDKVGRIRLAVY